MRNFLIYALVASALFQVAFSYDIYYGDLPKSGFEQYVDVPIVATNPESESGVLGYIRIHRALGNDKIIFDPTVNVDSSVIESVLNALAYLDNEGFDYYISYRINSMKVSGHSTGASIALGLICLEDGLDYDTDYIVSGDLDREGNLLETGGLGYKILPLAGKTLVANGEEYVYQNKDGNIFAVKAEKYADIYGVNLLRLSDIDEIMPIVLKQKL